MKNQLSVIFCALSLMLLINDPSDAQDWPQFRGPKGNGVLEKLEHPGSWGNDKNIAWSIDMPGGGLSSPIVVDNRIILTTAISAPDSVGGYIVLNETVSPVFVFSTTMTVNGNTIIRNSFQQMNVKSNVLQGV